jgi:hypothetical protein
MASKKRDFGSTFLNISRDGEVGNREEERAPEGVNDVPVEEVKPLIEPLPQQPELVQTEKKIIIQDNTAITNVTIRKVNHMQSEEEIMNTLRQNLEYIKQQTAKAEETIQFEKSRRFKAFNKKRNYSEKYRGVTLSIRPEILDIIEDLREVLAMDKYEIIETLLINGLKYTNFEEL